ncbi:MAG: hypothetical protein JXL84_03925 [Deltaproteobacteria bacterium]|nr:hypothetical protein [Deltaproteobacteria bacterium]
MDIFNPMGDYVEADKHKLAEALKEYWIRCGKWQGKQSDKQKKKVQRIKEILGSG